MRLELFFKQLSQFSYAVCALLFFLTAKSRAQPLIAENTTSKVWIADRGDGTGEPVLTFKKPNVIFHLLDSLQKNSGFSKTDALSIQ